MTTNPKKLARRSDPVASKDAARGVQRFEKSHADALEHAFRVYGRLTSAEAAELSGHPELSGGLGWVKAGKRLKALVEAKVLREAGTKRCRYKDKVLTAWEIEDGDPQPAGDLFHA